MVRTLRPTERMETFLNIDICDQHFDSFGKTRFIGDNRSCPRHLPFACPILSAIVARSLGRAVGRVHGHSAMHTAQPARSVKAGMHLSKSTYQRSTPRTICFFSEMASAGHARVHAWQVAQNSSPPKGARVVAISGMSVVTPASRTPDPKCRLIIDPCLPNSPSPDATAGGISSSASADGPGNALAV